MVRSHTFYEMQCALAAVGQLSENALTDLARHANDCASCREYISDMAEIHRQLFLVEAQRAYRKSTPAGMQERFRERAANAGIKIGRPAFTMSGPLFLRVAAIAALLIVSVSLSWKLFYFPDRASMTQEDSSASRVLFGPASKTDSPTAGQYARNDSPTGNPRKTRGKAAMRRSRPAGFGKSTSKDLLPQINPDRSYWANQKNPADWFESKMSSSDKASRSYNLNGIDSSPHLSLSASEADFFQQNKDRRPEERAFRYHLKVASLSLLEPPLDRNAEGQTIHVKFNAPILHLGSDRPAADKLW